MPSLVLRSAGLAIVVIVAAAANAGPLAPAQPGEYEAAVRAAAGLVAIAGSLYLTGVIGRTLLRSGGVAAFKAAYVAALALSGVGFAEAESAFCKADVPAALLAYCLVAIVSGLLWVRFYGRAA